MYTYPRNTLQPVIKHLWGKFLLYLAYLGGLYYFYNYLNLKVLDLSMAISTVLGVSVSLLLAFRTAAAYDRWWEARNIWGGIVNDSRTIVRQLIGFTSAGGEIIPEVKELAHLQIAWCKVLKNSLRKLDPLEGLTNHLSETVLSELKNHDNVPNAILNIIETQLSKLHQQCRINTYQFVAIDETIKRLCDEMGMCERIKNTVFPVQYSVYTRHGIILFIIMLPFGMLESTGPFVILISFFVAFFFAMIEAIAHYLKDPFENKGSDIPMTALCNTIEINILQMIGASELPLKAKPDPNGVLM